MLLIHHGMVQKNIFIMSMFLAKSANYFKFLTISFDYARLALSTLIVHTKPILIKHCKYACIVDENFRPNQWEFFAGIM